MSRFSDSQTVHVWASGKQKLSFKRVDQHKPLPRKLISEFDMDFDCFVNVAEPVTKMIRDQLLLVVRIEIRRGSKKKQ
jgi:hypothetical protein